MPRPGPPALEAEPFLFGGTLQQRALLTRNPVLRPVAPHVNSPRRCTHTPPCALAGAELPLALQAVQPRVALGGGSTGAFLLLPPQLLLQLIAQLFL